MPHHGRCAPSAVPRTATDGPRRRRVSGLMRAAESGVHPRVSGRGPGRFPGRGAGGEGGCAGGQGGCPGERDGGRAGGAGAGCRAFTVGVLGPGHPCGYDAALLGSCSGTAPGTAARARKGRRSRSQSGPSAAWSGSRSLTAAAGGAQLPEAGGGAGRQVGLAAARRADGDLVRAAAWLNLPRPLDRALAAAGHAGSVEGPRQVYARSAPGTSEEILSGPPADVLFGLLWRVRNRPGLPGRYRMVARS